MRIKVSNKKTLSLKIDWFLTKQLHTKKSCEKYDGQDYLV